MLKGVTEQSRASTVVSCNPRRAYILAREVQWQDGGLRIRDRGNELCKVPVRHKQKGYYCTLSHRSLTRRIGSAEFREKPHSPRGCTHGREGVCPARTQRPTSHSASCGQTRSSVLSHRWRRSGHLSNKPSVMLLACSDEVRLSDKPHKHQGNSRFCVRLSSARAPGRRHSKSPTWCTLFRVCNCSWFEKPGRE